jgi:PKHD-type hydroxylase
LRHYFQPNHPCAYADEIFSTEECMRISNDPAPLETAGSYSHSEHARHSRIRWLPVNDDTNWIYQRISETVLDLNSVYFQFDLDSIEDIQYTEYAQSYAGKFDLHSDDGVNVTRKLSFTLQLSDPADYEGCDVELYRFGPDEIRLSQPHTAQGHTHHKRHKKMPCGMVSWS